WIVWGVLVRGPTSHRSDESDAAAASAEIRQEGRLGRRFPRQDRHPADDRHRRVQGGARLPAGRAGPAAVPGRARFARPVQAVSAFVLGGGELRRPRGRHQPRRPHLQLRHVRLPHAALLDDLEQGALHDRVPGHGPERAADPPRDRPGPVRP
ncbi:hypothetical protein BVRB_042800, partial [Beta vulgaris subsp. vulgaris]